jgi:AraC-like DNA-binding protein
VAGLPGSDPHLSRTDQRAPAGRDTGLRARTGPLPGQPTTYDLLRFWIDLLDLLAPGDPGGSGVPDWLAKACTAMRAEENLRGGVPRLLELAGVSAAHLSRSMRAAYGVTPTAFVTDLRLEQAASLLAATSTSVAQIATRCGFTSQSYFSRCFTTAHNLTPTGFRHRSQRAFVP